MWESELCSNSAYLNLSSHRILAQTDSFDCLDQICQKKGHFQSKKQKSEHNHWILYIGICLGTKFQLKLTVLTFLTEVTQEKYFLLKMQKVNTSFEFCIFKLVCVPNFILNKQFWILGSYLPKMGKNIRIHFYIFKLVYNHLQNILD